MESPRPLEDSKQIRWIGRPSDEQLLGPLPRPFREVPISFEPPPPPDWGLSETPAADEDGKATRRSRLGPRDFVALAAVAAVVWLAVRGSEGSPFRSSEAAAPPPRARSSGRRSHRTGRSSGAPRRRLKRRRRRARRPTVTR